MSNCTHSHEPRILDFGPKRLIGVSRICKTSQDCHNVWADDNGFGKLAGETQPPYFALCTCAEGAEPGAFSYTAASPVTDSAPVPEGLSEAHIPAGTYAEFEVSELSEIGHVWQCTGEWLDAHPEWKGFCDGNPEGCGCIEHPSFEMYPPGFDGSGGLFIYVPLRRA